MAVTGETKFYKKRNFVSRSSHVIFYLLYKHQRNTKSLHACKASKGAIFICNHSNNDLFTCEDLTIEVNSGRIFCHYSPRLKRIIVLVYTQEVNWHLNSCVENVQATQSMRESVYRSFEHGTSK